MKQLYTLLILLIPFVGFNQSVTCSELVNYVESELGYPSTTYTYESSWLQKVEFYYYPDAMDYIAIAYIKENQYSFSYNKYIFCGISSWNKSNFSSKIINNSYGESFHEYIMPYKCNCY